MNNRRTYAPNRIKELRKARNITQEQIAERFGGTLTKATVAKLEAGQMALSVEYILGISRVLGVTPGEIITTDAPRAREIPLVGAVAAGQWREAIAESDRTMPVPQSLAGANLFGLDVSGDSMDQIVPDGGQIVVNPDDIDLVQGKVYVVANGDHETTFKRYMNSPPRLVPVSSNPDHKPIKIGGEPFIVIGRAVWGSFPI